MRQAMKSRLPRPRVEEVSRISFQRVIGVLFSFPELQTMNGFAHLIQFSKCSERLENYKPRKTK